MNVRLGDLPKIKTLEGINVIRENWTDTAYRAITCGDVLVLCDELEIAFRKLEALRKGLAANVLVGNDKVFIQDVLGIIDFGAGS